MLTRKILKNNPNNIIMRMQYAKLLTYDSKTRIRGIDIMMRIYNSNMRYKSLIELGKQAKLYGDFDVARYFFEELVKTSKISSIYAILELINLNMLENKFDEAYQLMEENYTRLTNVIDEKIIFNMDFHIRYKLGLIKSDEDQTAYYRRNLLSYNENDVMEHIQSHANCSHLKKIHTQYKENIDVRTVFRNVWEIIKDIQPSFSTSIDIYYIDYGEVVGSVNDEETTYLEVVTFINTKDILTIYPISGEIVNDERYNKQKTI